MAMLASGPGILAYSLVLLEAFLHIIRLPLPEPEPEHKNGDNKN